MTTTMSQMIGFELIKILFEKINDPSFQNVGFLNI